MAQDISIYIVKDPHGENEGQKEFLHLNFASIHAVASRNYEAFPWITSIDDYGHTFINHYQAKHLINEIRQLSLNQEQKIEADKIIDALDKLEQEQLLYFDGD